MNQVDLFGDQIMPEQHGSKLGADWDYPPFSVWNARDGWWQDRKRAWLSLGIKSELGRGRGQPGTSGQPMTAQAFDVRGGLQTWQKDKRGGGLTWGDRPQITSKGLNYYREKNGGK